MSTLDYLILFSRECLNCQALLGEPRKKEKNCHFSNGNDSCPALEIQFIVMDPIKRAAESLYKARQSQDIETELKILTKLKSKNKGFQQKFYETLSQIQK